MNQTKFKDLFDKVELLGTGQVQVWKYIRKSDN